MKKETVRANRQTDDRTEIVFGELRQTISPKGSTRWHMLVNGHTVTLSTSQLRSQSKFRNRCIEVVHIYPRKMSEGEWTKFIKAKLTECVTVMEGDFTKRCTAANLTASTSRADRG